MFRIKDIFSFCPRLHQSAEKGPTMLHPVSQQSPQGCPQNSANTGPVTTLVLTSEGEMHLLSFSICLSVWRSTLWCSGILSLMQFLKLLSTSALPSCPMSITIPLYSISTAHKSVCSNGPICASELKIQMEMSYCWNMSTNTQHHIIIIIKWNYW